MILFDVNVLVHAYREDSPLHSDIRPWLTDTMVIDIGGEWITTDRGFARFPGLRWRHPLH
jgi:predicted nucleic acid-binding protein